MKFGKNLARQQLPEYAPFYINYKALKKIINALDDPTHADALKDNRATFFFKLERELDKVNNFFELRESELKSRLNILEEQKRLFAQSVEDPAKTRPLTSLFVIREGYEQFEQDLNKLQQFVELNATGFYKALKKWDKRSKSRTKELYLSRQVEVRPCFNRDSLSLLVDTTSSAIVQLNAWANGEDVRVLSKQMLQDRIMRLTESQDLDVFGIAASGRIDELRKFISADESPERRSLVARGLVRAIQKLPDETAREIVTALRIDIRERDEISGRTVVHEAIIANRPELLDFFATVCPELVRQEDSYGKVPLHYACINAQDTQCAEILLRHGANVNVFDQNLYQPLHYAILAGSIEKVRLLLVNGANVNPRSEADYVPLAMACQSGNYEIAKLLLEYNAQILRNTEGLYPQHIVARAGYTGFIKLLMDHGSSLEARDAFNSWTPVFFAAAEGHFDALKELIDLGCKLDVLDEDGHSPAYQAAWEGHARCLDLLLKHGQTPGIGMPRIMRLKFDDSQDSNRTTPMTMDEEEDEHDSSEAIPELSLPPPIIPVRSYGHSYLDRKTFVQLILKPDSFRPLHSSRQAPLTDGKLMFEPSKLSILARSSGTLCDSISNVLPQSVVFPIADEGQVISFQVDSLDTFYLEFEVYPIFGSRILARTALSVGFFASNTSGSCSCPLFGPRVDVTGELMFDYKIITPFSGLKNFEYGSKIDTYWISVRSIAPETSTGTQFTTTSSQPGNSTESVVTGSSLSGKYIRAIIQVTKDGQPVVYPAWWLPVSHLNIAVSDVTYAQFCEICGPISKNFEDLAKATTPEEAQDLVMETYCSWGQLLEALAPGIKVHAQIAMPVRAEQKLLGILSTQEVNAFVDAILATTFSYSQAHPDARSILLSSCNADVCTALNWKQPNCKVYKACHYLRTVAVFLARKLGISVRLGEPASNTGDADVASAHGLQLLDDQASNRCMSVREAVKFAKAHNLVGLITSAASQIRIPALMQSIKKAGLVLVTHGEGNLDDGNRQIQDQFGVDGLIVDKILQLRDVDM